MLIYKILKYPHYKLRIKSKKVNLINNHIKKIIKVMILTMNINNGIGLAAPQVNINLSIIIIKKKYKKNLIMINPKIIFNSKILIKSKEGCLSIPKKVVKINRFKYIIVKAKNLQGKLFTLKAKNNLSICIQHEIDHLNGILCIDYLNNINYE